MGSALGDDAIDDVVREGVIISPSSDNSDDIASSRIGTCFID
jgi:hypothetical protein